MVYNHNDFHPPFGVYRESEVDDAPVLDSAVSDVRAGEKLIAELSPPGRGLLGLLLARYGPPDAPEPETYAEAYDVLQQHGLGLFYPKES
jgi:hypothetical protein